MATYCENDDLRLDTGKAIDEFMDIELSSSERESYKDTARERAYNTINNMIDGKTLVPATHIPMLKQIEIDLVVSDVMSGAFSGETANASEWVEKYSQRANDALENLKFSASGTTPAANSDNVGDGIVSAVTIFDDYTMTEQWTLTAINATTFQVVGSVTGRIYDLDVGESYPQKDWTVGTYEDYHFTYRQTLYYDNYPFRLTITAGAIPFVQYDRFTFKTYSASYFRQRTGKIIRA